MKKFCYTNIAKEILGDELFYEFLKKLAEENKNLDVLSFAEELMNKCSLLIVSLGMSKIIELDTIDLCLGGQIIKISSKEFARKYSKYIKAIDNNSRSLIN